jgi:hypothetical protein
VTRLFKKIHQQVDMLPPLTFHGLRHCFASLALAGGADIAVVSKLLGHASISITSDVYGHLVGTVASLAPPLGMDAAQPFHRCRSSSTVCWESTPRIAFLSPEPGSRKSRALEVDHETRSGRRQVPLSALAQPETKVRKI